jgi:hypothetical protein
MAKGFSAEPMNGYLTGIVFAAIKEGKKELGDLKR